MSGSDLTVRIFGKDVSASKALAGVGAKAKKELGGVSRIAAGVVDIIMHRYVYRLRLCAGAQANVRALNMCVAV